MSEFFIHAEDCDIERDSLHPTRSADLVDREGGCIYHFNENWSDDQIWMALDFANQLYEKGRKIGRAEKAREIRSALELE